MKLNVYGTGDEYTPKPIMFYNFHKLPLNMKFLESYFHPDILIGPIHSQGSISISCQMCQQNLILTVVCATIGFSCWFL